MSDEWNFPTGDLMEGKKAWSWAWPMTSRSPGASPANWRPRARRWPFSYMGESLLRRVGPLAESIGVTNLIEADVTDDASMDALFEKLKADYGTLDFVVHSIAFANKNELQGSFVDNTTREGFLLAMNVSAFSFVDVSRRAAEIMPNGGSLVTLTYLGSERVIPNYNTMGVAKAALEASTRYIARDLGPKGIPRQRHLGRRHAHIVVGRH